MGQYETLNLRKIGIEKKNPSSKAQKRFIRKSFLYLKKEMPIKLEKTQNSKQIIPERKVSSLHNNQNTKHLEKKKTKLHKDAGVGGNQIIYKFRLELYLIFLFFIFNCIKFIQIRNKLTLHINQSSLYVPPSQVPHCPHFPIPNQSPRRVRHFMGDH